MQEGPDSHFEDDRPTAGGNGGAAELICGAGAGPRSEPFKYNNLCVSEGRTNHKAKEITWQRAYPLLGEDGAGTEAGAEEKPAGAGLEPANCLSQRT